MGKPAELGPDDEVAALHMARQVVRSVEMDTKFPLENLDESDKYQVLIMAQALLKYRKMVPNI